MARDKAEKPERFQSSRQIKRLREDKDRRWRKLARADLKALASDSEGMDLLAKAIQAILRQDPSKSRSSKQKKGRR